MIQSRHLYPLFSDLIEAQKRSVLSFFEKGIIEEFELFSHVAGKNLFMIFHGYKFFLQKPLFSFEKILESQKTYSLSLFIPVEFQWNPALFADHQGLALVTPNSLQGGLNGCSATADWPRVASHPASQTVCLDSQLELDSPNRDKAPARLRAGLPAPAAGKRAGNPASGSVTNPPDRLELNGLLGTERIGEATPSPNQLNPLQTNQERAAGGRHCIFYFGEIPFMTERGNFLINGSSRVLVNQIVRCPSLYFKARIDHKNRRTFIGSFLSEYGAWLRLETDYKNRIWVRIDRTQRFSVYALLRTIGFPESFLKYQLKYYSFLYPSQEEYFPSNPHEAIQYIWKKCTPNRWNSLQGCYNFFYTKFFNPKKYSLGSIGRNRLNKRFGYKIGQPTGEPDAPGFFESRGQSYPKLPTLTPEDIFMCVDLLIGFHFGEGVLDDIDHLKHRRVRLPGELMQNQLRLALGRVTQSAVEKLSKIGKEEAVPPDGLGWNGYKVTGPSDQRLPVSSNHPKEPATNQQPIDRLNGLSSSIRLASNGAGFGHQGVSIGMATGSFAPASGSQPGSNPRVAGWFGSAIPNHPANQPSVPSDDSKKSGTRRPNQTGTSRLSGEFRFTGIGREAGAEHLTHPMIRGVDKLPAAYFIPTQLFSATFRELFNTSQLSQYMDQTNPLAEITHKRRLSSLGPGGIAKDQAGVAVREIHPSHFGRICPIETPEGQNAGLVGSLATYCQITPEGFLESAYQEHSRNRVGSVSRLGPSNSGYKSPDAAGSFEMDGRLFGMAEPNQLETDEPNQLHRIQTNPGPEGSQLYPVKFFPICSEWFVFQAEVEDEIFISAELPDQTYSTNSGESVASQINNQQPVNLASRDPVWFAAGSFGMAKPNQSAIEQTPLHRRVAFQRLRNNYESSSECFGPAPRMIAEEAVGSETDWRSQTVPFQTSAPPRDELASSDSNQSIILENYRKKGQAIPVRYKQEFFQVALRQVDFFGVSPIQMISLATSLIPFLEHDDANRALMGSNMQRQAVPLLSTERPYVGTGLEIQAARDSTTLSISPASGQIQYVDALSISIVNRSLVRNIIDDFAMESSRVPARSFARAFASQSGAQLGTGGWFGSPDGLFGTGLPAGLRSNPARNQPNQQVTNQQDASNTNGSTLSNQKFQLKVQKYWRSNQSTWLQSTPQVRVGDWVDAGDLLTDGAASAFGEIAFGKNILVAYLPWEGYNFEDAIVINQRLVTEDIYTSIHIERYDVDTKETEYGKEQIIRPNLASKTIHRLTESHGGAKSVGYDVLSAAGSFGMAKPNQHGSRGQVQGMEEQNRDRAKPAPDSRSPQTRYNQGMRSNPNPDPFHLETNQLDERGIVFPGSWVKENDILVGKITPIAPVKPTPEYRLLLAIFEAKPLPFKDTSLRLPTGVQGRVLECILDPDPTSCEENKRSIPAGPFGTEGVRFGTERTGEATPSPNQLNRLQTNTDDSKKPVIAGLEWQSQTNKPVYPGNLEPAVNQRTVPAAKPVYQAQSAPYQVIQSAQIFVASKRKIQLGDKMSGRHGNKGIVSLILPAQDMPFLPDGTPVDIVLNPLGVPSRMNVGQVLECLFGFASKYLKQNYRILPFDESNGADTSRGIVYQKLFEAASLTGKKWLFDPNHPGKIHLCDGRTGEHFHQPILVGYSYILKLIHQVDEKMHARSTGPYSLITQQPLGGRSKHGGQRLGEMEVWALEGFGSASILHEFLTLKSDDIDSRNTFLFYLMKRKSAKIPGSGYDLQNQTSQQRIDRLNGLAKTAHEGLIYLPDPLKLNRLAKPNRLPVPGFFESSFGTAKPNQLGTGGSSPDCDANARANPGANNHPNEPAANKLVPLQLEGIKRSSSSDPLHRFLNDRFAVVQTPAPTDQQESTVPESFRVLVHELQALCLSVYFNPEFRLTYPSLLGWDGLFFIPSKD